MSDIFKEFRNEIIDVLSSMSREGKLPPNLDMSRITTEPPRNPKNGDISTNAAMVLARQVQAKPGVLSLLISNALMRKPAIKHVVASYDSTETGFINIKLKDDVWKSQLSEILLAGPSYGNSELGHGRKVNVEYVSANPTGPLHVGHGRGAVVGDALASLLEKVGFEVVREYYVNDAGAQVDILARSLHRRYCQALINTFGPMPEPLYPGEYLIELGNLIKTMYGPKYRHESEQNWLPIFRKFAVDHITLEIRKELEGLGIKFNEWISEREIIETGAIEKALAELEKQGLIYVGTLEPPKGKLPEDWEARPQTLFRSTAFGDDVDRPLKKSDGSWTYFAADIAYHWDKYRRGFAEMIDVWGADHGGYVKRMQAAVKALTRGKGALDVKLCQLVNLYDKGQPVKMSKRAGTFVTLREAVEQVGKDVFRFVMLTRRNDQPLDFDFAKVVEQSKDNPVFYVQYAHARARSVLRLAHESMPGADLSPAALAKGKLELLTEGEEIALIRQMANWPRLVEAAAETHEPHRIAFYLQELAAAFHALWHKGKDDASLRFLLEGKPELTHARLALVQGMAFVIASGLKVFGVTPAEEMRG